MNAKRIAALLRELAEAIETPEPVKKPRRKSITAPEVEPSAEMLERARRASRKGGVAA